VTCNTGQAETLGLSSLTGQLGVSKQWIKHRKRGWNSWNWQSHCLLTEWKQAMARLLWSHK